MTSNSKMPIIVICPQTLKDYFLTDSETKATHPLTTGLRRVGAIQTHCGTTLLWITPQIENELKEVFDGISKDGKIFFEILFSVVKPFDLEYNVYESIKNFCGSKKLMGRRTIFVSDDQKLKDRLIKDEQTFDMINVNELNPEIEKIISESGLDEEMRI